MPAPPTGFPPRVPTVVRVRLSGWRWSFALAAWILGGVLGAVFLLGALLAARQDAHSVDMPTMWMLAAGFPLAGALGGWLLARSCRYTEVHTGRRVVQLANGGAVRFETVRAVALYETTARIASERTPLFQVALVTDLAGDPFVAACRAAAALRPGARRPALDAVEASTELNDLGAPTICANATARYAERAAGDTALAIDTVVLVIPAAREPYFVRPTRDAHPQSEGRRRYALLER